MCRLGELLALDSAGVEPGASAVWVRHHIVRVAGHGLIRIEGNKGGAGDLLLAVPQWSLPLWTELRNDAGDGTLFPSWNGQWIDPRNTRRRINAALEQCGFDWVTPHLWRKTAAMVLDEAGLSTNQIADQLGNTAKVVDQRISEAVGGERGDDDGFGVDVRRGEDPLKMGSLWGIGLCGAHNGKPQASHLGLLCAIRDSNPEPAD